MSITTETLLLHFYTNYIHAGQALLHTFVAFTRKSLEVWERSKFWVAAAWDIFTNWPDLNWDIRSLQIRLLCLNTNTQTQSTQILKVATFCSSWIRKARQHQNGWTFRKVPTVTWPRTFPRTFNPDLRIPKKIGSVNKTLAPFLVLILQVFESI